jgi:hypothetical protein
MGCCTAATIDFRFRGKPLRDKLNSPLLKQGQGIPKEEINPVNLAELGATKIRHFGFFRPEHRDTL